MINIRTTVETSSGEIIFNHPVLVMSEAENDKLQYFLEVFEKKFADLEARIKELESNDTPT